MTTRQRRPATEGFLALLPDECERSLRAQIKDLESIASQARTAGEHSRALALDGAWEEEQGFAEAARAHARGAAVDHRMACERLAELAAACRRLIRWAALDWRPSLDVADSGLTPGELACLVCVMGAEIDRSDVAA